MRGTRPKRWMKVLLKAEGLEPTAYLYVNKGQDFLVFREKESGRLVPVRY